MNSPPCHAAQNGWINSATSWLEKRTVIGTLISSGVATTARTQGSLGYGTSSGVRGAATCSPNRYSNWERPEDSAPMAIRRRRRAAPFYAALGAGQTRQRRAHFLATMGRHSRLPGATGIRLLIPQVGQHGVVVSVMPRITLLCIRREPGVGGNTGLGQAARAGSSSGRLHLGRLPRLVLRIPAATPPDLGGVGERSYRSVQVRRELRFPDAAPGCHQGVILCIDFRIGSPAALRGGCRKTSDTVLNKGEP
jgi:hypothetical protein